MNKRLLVINPYSPFFLYVPMGTFGLGDFLSHHNIQTRICNLALYSEGESFLKLGTIIKNFQPTHIGILFHWQETAHGVDDLIQYFSCNYADLPLIIGGITASSFSKQILDHYPRVDYLIAGDPEVPLLDLLNEKPLDEIANLLYREKHQNRQSPQQWHVPQPLLDSVSFANYNLLVDYELYFKKINTVLGYPLFLGRGCIFDCSYCGGSRTAFRHHASRISPITRNITSILRDLHTLKEITDTLYICYENDQRYILTLFQAIADDTALRGHFTLNYGAWHLLDDEFLDLYCKAFNTTRKSPIFEFSPEVISDVSRKTIKKHSTYTLQQLLDNCRAIEKRFHHKVKVELFFSRYHPTTSTAVLLREEINNIFSLKHALFLDHSSSIHIRYDHLSTDVASNYWDKYANLPFTEFLAQKELIDTNTRYPFPLDNLCFYIPETLSETAQTKAEALIHILKQLEQECHELFHTLFFCFGTEWIDLLATSISPFLTTHPHTFFTEPPLEDLLESFAVLLGENASFKRYSFLPDLIQYSLTKQKIASLQKKDSKHVFHEDTLYILNHQRITLHQHEYPDIKNFLHRIATEPPEKFPYQRTVVLYLHDEVLTLPHRSFRATLKKFEQPMRVGDYLEELQLKTEIDAEGHLETLKRLIANKILQPRAMQ